MISRRTLKIFFGGSLLPDAPALSKSKSPGVQSSRRRSQKTCCFSPLKCLIGVTRSLMSRTNRNDESKDLLFFATRPPHRNGIFRPFLLYLSNEKKQLTNRAISFD